MRRDDWLPQAKRIGIGSNIRVPHRGDRTSRPNLIIHNHADRWAAYCQSCKRGDVVFKEHVRITGIAAPASSTELSLPSDMQLVPLLAPLVRDSVLRFLASKHMDMRMLPHETYFSEARKRLLINTGQGWLGRDTTESSPQKWLTYNRSQYLGALAHGDIAVVVEDPFSYYKALWARPGPQIAVICSLGTGVRPALILELLRASHAVFLYDGDKAGVGGAQTNARRIRSMGIPTTATTAPWGLDPKDMQGGELRALIHREVNHRLQNIAGPREPEAVQGA